MSFYFFMFLLQKIVKKFFKSGSSRDIGKLPIYQAMLHRINVNGRVRSSQLMGSMVIKTLFSLSKGRLVFMQWRIIKALFLLLFFSISKGNIGYNSKLCLRQHVHNNIAIVFTSTRTIYFFCIVCVSERLLCWHGNSFSHCIFCPVVINAGSLLSLLKMLKYGTHV